MFSQSNSQQFIAVIHTLAKIQQNRTSSDKETENFYQTLNNMQRKTRFLIIMNIFVKKIGITLHNGY